MCLDEEIECMLAHRHTSASGYDGVGEAEDGVLYAKEMGMTAVALTDHGNMTNALKHHQAGKKHNIKAIIGIEGYHQPEFEPTKEAKRHHLTLLAKNLQGYHCLSELSTRAYRECFYMKPIMTFEMLEQHSEGVICLSGCVLGLLAQTIVEGNFDLAKEYTERFLKIYGENFFFEVQPQEFEMQKIANEGIIELARIYNRPIVMTSDSHFVRKEDLETYIIMRKIGYKQPKKGDTEITDDMFQLEMDKWEESIRKQYGELYMPTGKRLAERWKAYMGTCGCEYVRNSQMVADLVEEYDLSFPELVPDAIIEYDKDGNRLTPTQIIARKTKEGLIRLGKWYDVDEQGNIQYDIIEKNGKKVKQPRLQEKYVQRVKDELAVIKEKKYEAYFLMIEDLVAEARRKNIPVGPGRGSGGASMVARALNITEIDPVQFYCMFERFLQPHRSTLVDIDLDFAPWGRDYLFNYMKQKYAGKCASICNINRLTRDQLLNDLGRVLHIPDETIDKVKMALGKLGIGDKDKTVYPHFDELMKYKGLKAFNEKYNDALLHFCKLYGNMRNLSQHASGLAISSDQLCKYVPLFVRGKMREEYTAYDKGMLDSLGIVKIDILGVDDVATLYKACELANIDHLDIPLDDKETYDNYTKLNTVGIPQIKDSRGAQLIVQKVKPVNLEELTACISLNRPGSMEFHQLDVYIDGKNGKIDTSSLFYPYCEDTYGALTYQEHVMKICHDLADMSWASSTKVMKQLHGFNKRDSALAQEFIQGIKKKLHIVDDKKAEDVAWQMYQKLTGYTFNKAHALAYALLSYWMMYMKVHYPYEFYLAALQLSSKEYNVESYITDAAKNKIVVLLPHVNGSKLNYSTKIIQGQKFILSGLMSVKGVGDKAAIPIINEYEKNGPFKDTEDLLKRVNGVNDKGEIKKSPIKKDTYEALYDAGALEFDFDEYINRCSSWLSAIKLRDIQKRNIRYAKKQQQ